LIPASFNLVIAQRLVRRLCSHCKKETTISSLDKSTVLNIKNALSLTNKKELIERVGEENLKAPKFYSPV
jgi:type II secretory ATPase GspE/PulE/Tfp pilus assembly ATPase PilB-like protein